MSIGMGMADLGRHKWWGKPHPTDRGISRSFVGWGLAPPQPRYANARMPNYIRTKFEGGYYFFTVVTNGRARLFLTPLARRCLREAIDQTRSRHPFETVAFCLLPEHLHCVWKLPEGDADFSMRWASIKGRFSRSYLRIGGHQVTPSASRRRRGEAGLWQRRFWEHRIRDQRDLQRHVDYIHFNPLKHALVERIEDWPWSTYHRYVREGLYAGPVPFKDAAKFNTPDFGE